MKRVVLLLILVVIFALAEKEIQECTKKEAEKQAAKEECLRATAAERTSRSVMLTREREFKKAAEVFEAASAALTVAVRTETNAKIKYHQDEAAFKTANTAEHKLCNKLIRNVDKSTRCSRLLAKARKNNRLANCRTAQKLLHELTIKYRKSKAEYTSASEEVRKRKVVEISSRKLRDEANDRYKKVKAEWTVKNEMKLSTCSRYKSLSKAFGRTRKGTKTVCKQVTECGEFEHKCVESKNIKVCTRGVHVRTSCRVNAKTGCAVWNQEFKCEQERTVSQCVKNGLACKKEVTRKICFKQFRKPKVSGVKSCASNEVLIFKKKGRSLVRSCRAKNASDNRVVKSCRSYFDPAVQTFGSKSFSMSTEGDYEMYSSLDGSVEVHARQSLLKGNPMTVNSRIAILANGVDVVKIACSDANQYSVNDGALKKGTTSLTNGGSVNMNGNQFTIQAANGDSVQGYVAGSGEQCWINLFVYTKETNGAGFCFAENHDQAIERRVVGLFSSAKLPRATSGAIAREQEREFRNVDEKIKKAAEQACNISGIQRSQKARCIREWSLANASMRPAIIQGYGRLVASAARQQQTTTRRTVY